MARWNLAQSGGEGSGGSRGTTIGGRLCGGGCSQWVGTGCVVCIGA